MNYTTFLLMFTCPVPTHVTKTVLLSGSVCSLNVMPKKVFKSRKNCILAKATVSETQKKRKRRQEGTEREDVRIGRQFPKADLCDVLGSHRHHDEIEALMQTITDAALGYLGVEQLGRPETDVLGCLAGPAVPLG